MFGQSAGAIGIGSLILADRGRAVSKLNLFHAGTASENIKAGQFAVVPVLAGAFLSWYCLCF